MTWDDHDYYRLRALQEQAAAARATSAVARERHLELSDLYEQRLRPDWSPGRPGIVVMPLWVARPRPEVPLAMAP